MKALFIEPMLCVATYELPSGPVWSYELKLDGYRTLAIKADGRRSLLSRNSKDLSGRFAEITKALLPSRTRSGLLATPRRSRCSNSLHR